MTRQCNSPEKSDGQLGNTPFFCTLELNDAPYKGCQREEEADFAAIMRQGAVRRKDSVCHEKGTLKSRLSRLKPIILRLARLIFSSGSTSLFFSDLEICVEALSSRLVVGLFELKPTFTVPSRRRECHSAAPPLPLVGVSIVMERGCQQNDSLADG